MQIESRSLHYTALPYIISRKRYIVEKVEYLCYDEFDQFKFNGGQ